MLPKIHPLTKTFIDLKRCEVRLDEYLARFPEEMGNDQDRFLQLLEMIREAKTLIPKHYT